MSITALSAQNEVMRAQQIRAAKAGETPKATGQVNKLDQIQISSYGSGQSYEDSISLDKISTYISQAKDRFYAESRDNGGPIDRHYEISRNVYYKKKIVEEFNGTPEEKKALQAKIEQEYYDHEAELEQKQNAIFKKYENDPEFQARLNEMKSNWGEYEYLKSLYDNPKQKNIFLGSFLSDQVRYEGVTLTQEEREAFPDAANWEYMKKTHNYETITKPYSNEFNQALKANGISVVDGERFSLDFDQNYRFTVSGIDTERASKIGNLINSNLSLRMALVENLYGRYCDDGKWYSDSETGTPLRNSMTEFFQFREPLVYRNSFQKSHNYQYSDTKFCGYIGETPIFKFLDGGDVPKEDAKLLERIRLLEENLPSSFLGFTQSPIIYKNNEFHAAE